MSFVGRGAKNAFRNGVRTFSIVIILGLSTGLALTMVLARGAVQARINSVKSSIGNTITVSPAGARGFQGGGEPLTSADLTKVTGTSHVVSTTATLQDRLTSTDTNLVSAIEAGSLGRRNNGGGAGGGGNGGAGGPGGAGGGNFTPPIFVVGTNNLSGSVLNGGGTITITSGSKFDPNKDANVALVGKSLADKNSLKVGSNFQAYGATITVDGIFDSGNTFSNNSLVMPLSTVQRLSAQPGDVSDIIVQVDSISNLAPTVTAIQNSLGTSVADVVSAQDTSNQALAPLQNIQTITLYSLIGAVAAGAAIIFLTMLMIVRERRREIGVFKAIGASNVKIVTQFVSEAMVLTLLGSLVGIAAGVAFSNSVVKLLVTTNTATQGGGGRGFGRAFIAGGRTALTNIHTVVGFNVVLYGLLGAIIIGFVGSAIPAFLISKVRPAEVMRGE